MSGAPSPRYNLAVRRGTSNVIFHIENRYDVMLSEPATAGTVASPLTKIYVNSVPLDLPSGFILEFKASAGNCTVHRLTTDGITIAGSRSINIQPYVGKQIPCQWKADVGPVDLTGRVYRAQVKKKATDTTPYLTLDCTTTPLEGVIDISCTTVGTEDFNATFIELPETSEDLQLIDATDPQTGALIYPRYKKVIESSWFWDLEYKQGTKIVSDYVGRFWLVAEATVIP